MLKKCISIIIYLLVTMNVIFAISGCTVKSTNTKPSAEATINPTAKSAVNEQPVQNPSESAAGQTTGGASDGIENLYGTWSIWIPGTAVSLYDKKTGDYVTHEYNKGAEPGKIVINKDGTYSMSHGAWAKDKTVKGKWRQSHPAEINGEEVTAIILIDGITDTDWAVAPAANGKIRLLSASEWGDGSTLWVFDSELYKK